MVHAWSSSRWALGLVLVSGTDAKPAERSEMVRYSRAGPVGPAYPVLSPRDAADKPDRTPRAGKMVGSSATDTEGTCILVPNRLALCAARRQEGQPLPFGIRRDRQDHDRVGAPLVGMRCRRKPTVSDAVVSGCSRRIRVPSCGHTSRLRHI
jgi:hypothetical protein